MHENRTNPTEHEHLSLMREWLADCEWRDITADEIAELPAHVIVRAVSRHYCGGLRAFAADMGV